MLISSSPNWYSSSVIGSVDDQRIVFCSRSPGLTIFFSDFYKILYFFKNGTPFRQSLFCYTVTKDKGVSDGFGVKEGFDFLLLYEKFLQNFWSVLKT